MHNSTIYVFFILLRYTQIVEKNEIGGECSAYGRVERHIQGFGGETCEKMTTWETQR